MKKLLILVLITSLNAVAAPNSIVAIVNDNLVTYDVVDTVKNKSKAAKIAAVNHQIDIILQMDKVSQLGINPKESAINNMLKRIAKQNSLSFAQLQAAPVFGQVVKDVRQKLSLNGLKELISNKASISLSKAEIDKALMNNPATANDIVQQIRIAQIAISSTDKAASLLKSEDEIIKELLIDLASKIQQGESFSALAKLHSQDESYKNGGESDWLIQNRLPLVFLQALDKLKLQEVSAPFKAGNGWRLVKIIEKRSVDTHLSNIKSALIRQKKNAYFSNWVERLRKDAYIEIFDHKL